MYGSCICFHRTKILYIKLSNICRKLQMEYQTHLYDSWIFIFNKSVLAQLIYFFLPTVQADNQINNDLVFQSAPAFYILTAVIFAPFLEETIFRGCIFAKIREKHSFLLSATVSGCAFGFLHIVASLLTQNYSNCIFFVIYAMCGFVLCIPYEDTDTITTSIFSHMLYNFMTILITLWMS